MPAVIGGNDAHVMHRFVEQRHVLLVLNDLYWVKPGGLIEGTGNPGKMAPGLRIFISASQTVHSFGFSFQGVFVSRHWRTASSAACCGPSTSASAAASSEICSIQRADEQPLKATGTL